MTNGAYVLRDGEKVNTSFTHLLFYGLPRSRTLRRKTEIKYVSNPAPAPASAPAPAPQPAPAEAPAAAPAAAPATATPEAPPQPEAPAATPTPEELAQLPPPDPEPTPEATPQFTAADDENILKLKEEKKSWAQIGEVVKGKNKNDLRDRYKVLMAQRGQAPAGAAPAPAPSPAVEGEGKKGKKQKGKGKIENENQEQKVEGGVKEQAMKMESGEGKALVGCVGGGGMPIIYLEEKDGLDFEEMKMAYDLYVHDEGRKWTKIASRIFDRTGKRVDPSVLKARLGHLEV